MQLHSQRFAHTCSPGAGASVDGSCIVGQQVAAGYQWERLQHMYVQLHTRPLGHCVLHVLPGAGASASLTVADCGEVVRWR
jgi:hypothetical protein